MNWFYFSLLSIFALAAAELTQQHLLNSKTNIEERTSAVLTFLVQSIFTIPIIIFSDLRHSIFAVFDPSIFPFLLLGNFIGSIAMIYYLRSFKVKNISISTIFIAFSVVVSTTLGIIFFSESLYLYKLLGIALVLLAIVSLNISNFQLEKNHFYGLIAGTMFGITYSIDKYIITDSIQPIIYIFCQLSTQV